jgi:IclR family transcriptional regulator, acetate operon repressor
MRRPVNDGYSEMISDGRTTESEDSPQVGPLSVNRTLEILKQLSLFPDGRTLAELTVALQQPKSSILNLLKSLDAGGYVVNTGRRYILGIQALNLAQSISNTISFPASLRPTLEQLALRSGETSVLAVIAGDAQVSFVEVQEGRNALRLHVLRGGSAPITSVVVGRVLLAFAPAARREEILRAVDAADVARYLGGRKQAEKMLQAIRAQGYEAASGGLFGGVMGVAAPVFGHGGGLRCAVAIGGPIERIQSRLDPIRDNVLEAARDMSRILGFDPTTQEAGA